MTSAAKRRAGSPPASFTGVSPNSSSGSSSASPASTNVNIVGAGLAGALLALLLAKRGFEVKLFERRSDPRGGEAEGGRSINLALAARGIRALERAGVMDSVRPLLIPMRGRMVHDTSGTTALHPYGQGEHEVIYSVGRAALNRLLIEEAARYDNVEMRFEQTCIAAIPEGNTLRFHNRKDRTEYDEPLAPTIATDGAGSAVRTSLARTQQVTVKEDWLDHDYKELTISAAEGRHVLDGNSLHIWPRGGFMLIALPNTDGSFTATLFLCRTGQNSFATLKEPAAVDEFFKREFASAVPLMPNLLQEFAANPQGQLGTVHVAPWHIGGSVLLLGDAAHAIVPFHGQGMNAAFEDCVILDSLLDQHSQWETLFAEFSRSRGPNAAAIAAMALENYTEMRHTVLDAGFVRQKSIAMELERRFPDRFIPRYSMVMFHPEIPYAEAQRRGAVQAEILAELDSRRDANGGTDANLAERLLKDRLEPVGSDNVPERDRS
jgi:kynurenine 3-monooxygenase